MTPRKRVSDIPSEDKASVSPGNTLDNGHPADPDPTGDARGADGLLAWLNGGWRNAWLNGGWPNGGWRNLWLNGGWPNLGWSNLWRNLW